MSFISVSSLRGRVSVHRVIYRWVVRWVIICDGCDEPVFYLLTLLTSGVADMVETRNNLSTRVVVMISFFHSFCPTQNNMMAAADQIIESGGEGEGVTCLRLLPLISCSKLQFFCVGLVVFRR